MNSASLQAASEKHSPMLLGVLSGLIAAAALLWYWQPEGPTAAEVTRQSIVLNQLRQNALFLSKRPSYPPLTESWQRVLSRYEACGLAPRIMPESDGGKAEGRYHGPVAAWHARITGPTPRVLGCTLTLPTDVFIRPASFSINHGQMMLTLAVLGREGISLAGQPYNVSGDTP